MPAKIDADSNLRFLYSCFKHSNYSTINYNNVAVDFDIKAPAARMRLMRLKIALDGQNALQKRFGTGNVPNYPSICKGQVSGGGGGKGDGNGSGGGAKGKSGFFDNNDDDDDDEGEDDWRVRPGWIHVKAEEEDGKALAARRRSWGRNGGVAGKRIKSEVGGDRKRRFDGGSGGTGIRFQTEDLFGSGGKGKMEEEAFKVEGVEMQSALFKTEVLGEEMRFKTEDVLDEPRGLDMSSGLKDAYVSVKMENDVRDSPVLFKNEDVFGMTGIPETGHLCRTPMSIDLEATIHTTPVQPMTRDTFTTPTTVKTEEMDTKPLSPSFEPMLVSPISFNENKMYHTPLSVKTEETDDSTMTDLMTRNDTPMDIKTETTDDTDPKQSTPGPFPTRELFATPMSGKTEELVISPLTEAFKTPPTRASMTKNMYQTPTSVKTETRDSFAVVTERTPRSAKEENSLERCMSLKEEVLQEVDLEENSRGLKKEVLQDTQMGENHICDVAASSVLESPATLLSGPVSSAVQRSPFHHHMDNEDESKAWAAIPSPVSTDMKEEDNIF